MTASILKQDPNTWKIEKNTILVFSYVFVFFKIQHSFKPFMCLDLVQRKFYDTCTRVSFMDSFVSL